MPDPIIFRFHHLAAPESGIDKLYYTTNYHELFTVIQRTETRRFISSSVIFLPLPAERDYKSMSNFSIRKNFFTFLYFRPPRRLFERAVFFVIADAKVGIIFTSANFFEKIFHLFFRKTAQLPTNQRKEIWIFCKRTRCLLGWWGWENSDFQTTVDAGNNGSKEAGRHRSML